jgi:hypothetical protein
LGQEAPQISSIVHLVAAVFRASIVPHSIEQIRADGQSGYVAAGRRPSTAALTRTGARKTSEIDRATDRVAQAGAIPITSRQYAFGLQQ